MLIFQRFFLLQRIKRNIQDFQKQFWSGINLNELFDKLRNQKSETLSAVFQAGFGEYLRIKEQSSMKPDAQLENISRAMRICANNQIESLQSNLNFLATVGSVSPYIGLFGTVWGIMTSFSSLGGAQQATIAMVAPGISEALIATAFGLFAAIPAVIAYNRFTHGLNSITHSIDNFAEELIKILHRKVHT